ncbi:MAG TPA: HEAT repeat domain-containing protein [Planctomycetota bacterium]|nr:HEAT repeat domain-containing protein [Planctomycetota bacterium]
MFLRRCAATLIAAVLLTNVPMRAEEPADEAKIKKLIFTLQNIGPKDVLVPLLNLMEAGKLPSENVDEVIWSIGAALETDDLSTVFTRVLAAKPQNVSFQAKLLSGLSAAARERDVKPKGDLAAIKPLLVSKDDAVRAEALRTAGAWKLEPLRADINAAFESADSSATVRQAAMEALVIMGGKASQDVLEKVASSGPLRTRYVAVSGLSSVNMTAAAPIAAEILSKESEGEGAFDVFAAFGKREGGCEELAKALEGKKLPPDNAKLGLRFLQALGREEAALLKVLRASAGIGVDISELEEAEQKKIIAGLMADVASKGDPARGERVFRRVDLNCFSCHGVGGAGGQVGPDLAGIGAGSQLDYLTEAVMLPSKVVKEGFEAGVVVTKSGEFHSGIIKSKNDDEVVLKDAINGEMTFAMANVKRFKQGGSSLMPNSLTAPLTRGETLDLIRFLSELGRGPYSVTAAPIVRRWRLLSPVPDDIASLSVDAVARLAQGDKLAWVPAYSLVSGEFPVSELVRAKAKAVAFARFEFEMTTPGKMRLKVNSPKGLALALNDAAINMSGDMALDVPRGIHAVTVRVELEQRGAENLRVELEELPGSPGRFQVISGK